MNEDRNSNQRLQLHVSNHIVVLFEDPVQSCRCFIWRKRCKQYFGMTVRISCTDIVLYVLGMSGNGIIRMGIQDLMQLQNVILRDRDHIKAFMND